MTSATSILRIDSSARKTGSTSRRLTDLLVEKLSMTGSPSTVVTRDVSTGPGFHTEAWVEGTYTPEENRTHAHKEALTESDIVIEELKNADTLVIAAPMYNFTIGATLKAWIDLIPRPGITFGRDDAGNSIGLLPNIETYIIYAAGGTKQGSDEDFASPYLQHILSFVGITNVTFLTSEEDIQKLKLTSTSAA